MKIQPSDIEAKARQIQDALEQTKESAQNTAVLAGVAVFLFVLVRSSSAGAGQEEPRRRRDLPP